MRLNPAPGAAPNTPPAQGQVDNHLQASQMAHAAAQKAAIGKVLTGGSKSPPSTAPKAPNYKAHVLGVAGMHGTGSVDHVHAAIDAATNAGAFTPGQGAALKAHNGPLHGPQGAHTIATLGTTLANMQGS